MGQNQGLPGGEEQDADRELRNDEGTSRGKISSAIVASVKIFKIQ
jgi:hypothetical protein